MKGIRDPKAMQLACERMDQTREEIFRRNGLLDFAVPTIRAVCDGDADGDCEWGTCSTRTSVSRLARIGVYDCLYTALVEREGCELITADDRLKGSLPSHRIILL
jgi:hypothetical protein